MAMKKGTARSQRLEPPLEVWTVVAVVVEVVLVVVVVGVVVVVVVVVEVVEVTWLWKTASPTMAHPLDALRVAFTARFVRAELKILYSAQGSCPLAVPPICVQ